MQARIKALMIKPAFAQALQSPNGHIYMKVLRERVLDELNFKDGMSKDEMEFHKTFEANMYRTDDSRRYYVDQMYNLNELDNE